MVPVDTSRKDVRKLLALFQERAGVGLILDESQPDQVRVRVRVEGKIVLPEVEASALRSLSKEELLTVLLLPEEKRKNFLLSRLN